jgi:hypothetical protein
MRPASCVDAWVGAWIDAWIDLREDLSGIQSRSVEVAGHHVQSKGAEDTPNNET